MLLYPRLPLFAAQLLAREYARTPVESLLGRATRGNLLQHPDLTWAPFGGNRVTESRLFHLMELLNSAAYRNGLPEIPSTDQRRRFDAEAAIILYDNMKISPSEAARDGVWQYMTCILAPALVRWRFRRTGAEGSSEQRFLGGTRNTFRRLWWRAWILGAGGDPAGVPALLGMINEDEMVQLAERPTLFGDCRLTRTSCEVFVEMITSGRPEFIRHRMDVMREAQKRIMRLFVLVSFDVLSDDQLKGMVRTVFDDALQGLVTSQKAR